MPGPAPLALSSAWHQHVFWQRRPRGPTGPALTAILTSLPKQPGQRQRLDLLATSWLNFVAGCDHILDHQRGAPARRVDVVTALKAGDDTRGDFKDAARQMRVIAV